MISPELLDFRFHEPTHEKEQRQKGENRGLRIESDQEIVASVQERRQGESAENCLQFSFSSETRQAHRISPHGRKHYVGRRGEQHPRNDDTRP